MEQLEHPSPLVALINGLLAPMGVQVPDFLVFCALIVLICLGVGLFIRSRLSVEHPSTLQIALEDMVSFIVDQLENLMGHKGKQFLPLVGTIFVFILIGNLMGQIPGLGAPTSNINVPLGCALTVWVYYHFQGLKAQGVGS